MVFPPKGFIQHGYLYMYFTFKCRFEAGDKFEVSQGKLTTRGASTCIIHVHLLTYGLKMRSKQHDLRYRCPRYDELDGVLSSSYFSGSSESFSDDSATFLGTHSRLEKKGNY